jgi:prophage regulatory protein
MKTYSQQHTVTPRVLRQREVCRQIGLGKSALYAAIQEGRFPQQVQLGPRAVGWLESEVSDWIAARAAERDIETEEHVV